MTYDGKPDALVEERRKWDAYYAGLPAEEQCIPAVQALYHELAETVSGIVPRGSRVLEAGCGSGRVSLALAQSGGLEVTLLDFSETAIAHARAIFERAGVRAQFQVGDATGGEAAPEYDLVFNAGVLEHYDFARQVAFFGGMKRRSRRYVLALVPNRACYWYWIWRLQTAAAGQWPFGYEKPASDYRAAIEGAGLHYLGRAYLGASAVEHFLTGLAGLDQHLREQIAAVHRQEVVPVAQRSYLVGFLASVREGDRVPAGFSADAVPEAQPGGDWADRYVTLAADALAAQIATRQRLARLEHEAAGLREQLAAAEAKHAELEAASNTTPPVGALGRLMRLMTGRG
jgi:SAM-dependent methyltransferase